MKLKVNLPISDSCLGVTKPPQDHAMADIATHWGHLRQWLYGGQRAVNKSYLPSVSESGQDQNIRSCVTKMMVCTLNWMMTWWSEGHGVTLPWQNLFCEKTAFECCDGLYQIALLDSWLVQTATPMMSFIWKEGHFSEIHRSIAQAQRKQIYDELLSPLTQPLVA